MYCIMQQQTMPFRSACRSRIYESFFASKSLRLECGLGVIDATAVRGDGHILIVYIHNTLLISCTCASHLHREHTASIITHHHTGARISLDNATRRLDNRHLPTRQQTPDKSFDTNDTNHSSTPKPYIHLEPLSNHVTTHRRRQEEKQPRAVRWRPVST
jgi:hypothetical protein